jgi:hypothetical protein
MTLRPFPAGGKPGSTPAHDPPCPGCVAEARSRAFARSVVARELGRIAAKSESSSRRASRAAALTGECDLDALAEAREANAEFWAVGMAMADLLLLFFRCGLRHRREELSAYLYDVLRPEFEAMAAAVARKGVRR